MQTPNGRAGPSLPCGNWHLSKTLQATGTWHLSNGTWYLATGTSANPCNWQLAPSNWHLINWHLSKHLQAKASLQSASLPHLPSSGQQEMEPRWRMLANQGSESKQYVAGFYQKITQNYFSPGILGFMAQVTLRPWYWCWSKSSTTVSRYY